MNKHRCRPISRNLKHLHSRSNSTFRKILLPVSLAINAVSKKEPKKVQLVSKKTKPHLLVINLELQNSPKKKDARLRKSRVIVKSWYKELSIKSFQKSKIKEFAMPGVRVKKEQDLNRVLNLILANYGVYFQSQNRWIKVHKAPWMFEVILSFVLSRIGMGTVVIIRSAPTKVMKRVVSLW